MLDKLRPSQFFRSEKFTFASSAATVIGAAVGAQIMLMRPEPANINNSVEINAATSDACDIVGGKTDVEGFVYFMDACSDYFATPEGKQTLNEGVARVIISTGMPFTPK